MTNLIMTVIGIVLAAIAALIAFDYGGDYFLEGYNRAQATSISNAGNNVEAAYSVFGVQRRRPPASLDELTSSPQGRSLLKRMPDIQGLGVVRDQWVGLDRGKGSERAFVVEGVAPAICRTLNQRLNDFGDDAVIPGSPAFKSGCFSYNNTTVNVYYTFLGGVPEGGTLNPYTPVTPGSPLPTATPTGSGGWTWPAAPTTAPSALPTPVPAPTTPINDGGWIDCATEGQACSFNGEATVRYGVDGSYYSTTGVASVSCVSGSFGGDPAQGSVKGCSYRAIPQQDGWQFCSNEGTACSFGAKMRAEVRFGALGAYTYKTVPTGTSCSASAMGEDPASGRTKACYFRNAEVVPDPLPTATPGVGVDSCSTGGIVATSSVADPDGIVGSILPAKMCRGDQVSSPGGRFRFTLNTDGNLVVAFANGDMIWSSGTSGGDGQHFDVQSDGNAVLYNANMNARWSTGTDGQRGQMRLTSDGDLVVYNADGSRIVWETRTDYCQVRKVTGGGGNGGYGRASTLVPNRFCNNEYVDSPDGRFRLTMQPDGKLSLAMGDAFDKVIWASSNTSGYKMNVQSDGNSVVYGRDGGAKFSTGTNGWNGARMMVESDGNLTVRTADNSRLLWETRTEYCLPTRVGDGRREGDFGVQGSVLPSRLCNNEFIESPDARFRLIMQPDGDLSLRMGENYATQIWHSGTTSAYKAETGDDGNIVLRNRDGGAAWSTGTNGWSGARMSLQSDGNLVVRSADNSRLIWETHSVFCLPADRGLGQQVGDFDVLGTAVGPRLCTNEYVNSPNGRFRLTMTEDGNVVMKMGDQVIWQTGTTAFYRLLVQSNGDMRLTRRDGSNQTMTGTDGWNGARLVVQDDGNLVVRDAGNTRTIWETNSVYCLPREMGRGSQVGDFGVSGTRVSPRLCNNEYVTSPNGRFRLTMTNEGNLTMAMGDGFTNVIWQTGTSEFYRLLVQGNGDMRMTRRNGTTQSVTGTDGWNGAQFVVQDDGNLVVRDSGNTRVVWETHSVYCLPREMASGTQVGDFGVVGTRLPPRLCNNEYVTSANGRFRVTMKPNGSLSIGMGENYATEIWSTNTTDFYRLLVQGNGDMRLFRRNGTSQSVTGTDGWNGAQFVLQDDGNLVVRDSGNTRVVWESNSVYCLPAERGVDDVMGDYGVNGRSVGPRMCSNEYTTSPNKRFRLTMQPDGNLVLAQGAQYDDVIWQTGTSNFYRMLVQGNGDMRLFRRDGSSQSFTGTDGWNGAKLSVQDDGNLVVRSAANDRLIWESRSNRCLPNEVGAETRTAGYGVSARLVPARICNNEYVTSPNGRFRLVMGADGTLALKGGQDFSETYWSANRAGGYKLESQGNGDMRIFGRDGGSQSISGTDGWNGARLMVQDDGNLTVRSADNTRLLWETRTDRCAPAEAGAEAGTDNYGVPGRFVGQRICNNQYVTSPNGRFRLTMRADGNMVIGQGEGYGDLIWQTNTAGSDGYKLEAQSNGDMVIYRRNGSVAWRTGTDYRDGARMLLNDLGNLVVVRNQTELYWESRSDRCLPASISAGVEASPSGAQATRMPFILCQNEWVDSPNGRFRFTLTPQGDLQLLDGVNHDIQLWHSGTSDPSIYRLFMWGDGNVWLMDRNGTNRWQTGTNYNDGSRLLVQDDGNVAAYRPDGRMIWQTGTGGKTGPTPGSDAEKAVTVRQSGSLAYTASASLVRRPSSLADVGLETFDFKQAGSFSSFYPSADRLMYEVKITGGDPAHVCQLIADAVGGNVTDRAQETTTAEGCASFSSGYYYWRRIDDAQADVQARFARSFGAAVYGASASLTSQPTDLNSVGMAGAERYDLLGRSGFEASGENWQFYILVNSLEACRRMDALAGNGTRTIDRNTGFSYTLDEGCGGEGGNLFYFKNVNGAYDAAIARKVFALGNGAVAASFANGGETVSAGRDAASSYLASGADGYGFITRTGVYSSGAHYTAEMRIASAAACRRIDVAAGNGDRGADLVYDPTNQLQGCGRYSDGTYWYWRRLDQKVLPGAVFDAKAMFSMDSNDDPNGVWNYLESNPTGGADIALMNKGGCSWGDCVRGDVDAIRVSNPMQDSQIGSSIFDGSALNLHPGPDRDALVRFRAPVAGYYRVTGMYRIGDTSPSGINANWGQGDFYLDGSTPSYAFNYVRRMAEGELLTFRLNRASVYYNDSTNMNATMTYLGTSAPADQPSASSGHRYWRVLAHRANGNGSSGIVAASEIEFHGEFGGSDLTGAPGGTVIKSAEYNGSDFRAANAFDNDPGTNYASVGGDQSNINQWIGYDFGAGNNVDVKEVTWRTRADAFTPQHIGSGSVQWSDDGSTWSTSFDFVVDPVPSGVTTSVIRATPVTAPDAHRYWRVRGYDANDPYMRSSELEMREAAGGPNVARYGIPLASSSYNNSGYSPYYAFDGTTAGNAWATSGGLGWIGVDMLVPRSIKQFSYGSAEGPKAPTDFALEWSDDKVSWTEAWRTRYSDWGNTELRTFSAPDPNAPPPPPVVATSVVLTSASGTCIQIAEFEAYAGGVNVAAAANGGVASGSAPYSGDANINRINDGVKPAGYPSIFHSGCGSGDYARVDFAQAVTLDKLVLYGRSDCCGDRDRLVFKAYNGTTQVSSGILDARTGSYGETKPVADTVWSLDAEYTNPVHFEFSSSEGPLVKEGGSSGWWRMPGYSYWGMLYQSATSIIMHPGPGVTQSTIVTFVAPSAGSYSITGGFRQSGCGGDGVVTQVGGFDPVTLAPCTSTPFSFNRSMQAGDRIPFTVSNNGTDAADSTEITLAVRPL